MEDEYVVFGEWPLALPFSRGFDSRTGDGARMRMGETDGLRMAGWLLLARRAFNPFANEPFLCSSDVLGCREGLRWERQVMVSTSRRAGEISRSQVWITRSIAGGGEGKFSCSQ